MNQKILKMLLALFACLLSNASASTSVEVRGAAFIPSSHRFRDVYQDVGPNYQLEVATSLCNYPCYEFWTNFDWYSKTRKRECYKTEVIIPTVSSGLKYIFHNPCFLPNFKFYLGLGISLNRTYLKNKSCCLDESFREKKSDFSVGGVVKSGICYEFCHNFFLDLFVDYFYQPVNFHKCKNVGGIKTGAGLGMRF